MQTQARHPQKEMTHSRTYDNKAETNADIRTNARAIQTRTRTQAHTNKKKRQTQTQTMGEKRQDANTDANVCTNRTTQCTESTTSVMCSEGTEEWGDMCSEGTEEWGDEMHIL